jgi:outer membrane biogenesis lipoprotein LolB
MKRSFLAAAAALLLFACNTEKKEAEVAKNSDWYAQHLKGNVQTVEETIFTADSLGTIGEMDSC